MISRLITKVTVPLHDSFYASLLLISEGAEKYRSIKERLSTA
jgi:hypothetical protein